MGEKLLGKPVADEIYTNIDYYIEKFAIHPICNVIYDNTTLANRRCCTALSKHGSEHKIRVEKYFVQTTPSENAYISFANKVRNAEGASILLRPCWDYKLHKWISEFIRPMADIDCLAESSKGINCGAKAIIALMNYYSIDVKGKTVCILSNGNAVSMDIVGVMMQEKANIINCNSDTPKYELKQYLSNADIIISCLNTGRVITEDILRSLSKKHRVFIDAGISMVKGHHLVGDLSDYLKNKYFSQYTSADNGISLITTAVMLDGVVSSYIEESCIKGEDN